MKRTLILAAVLAALASLALFFLFDFIDARRVDSESH